MPRAISRNKKNYRPTKKGAGMTKAGVKAYRRANPGSKLKTFIQMISIAILLTGESGNKIINFQDYNAQTIGIILLWLSAFLTLYTGYDYLRKGIDHAIDQDTKD